MVLALELVVGRLPGTTHHDQEVAYNARLSKRPESLLLDKLMRVHILSCGFAPGREEDVIPHQCSGVEEKDESENDERKGNWKMLHALAERDLLAVRVGNDLDETRADEVGGENCGRGNKCKEISVVAFSDTVIEPDTVVVVGLDTVIAKATVVGTWRAPDVASSAVLNGDFHGGRVGLSRFD